MQVEIDMKEKHKGSHAELKAAAWLLEQGFEVFKNVSQHGDIDIVAIKDGEVRRFDVKKSYRGGCPKPGIEYLFMMGDGSFRIMGARRPRVIMRELTPRERILKKLGEGSATTT